ncbi:MAG: TetR family transcriptional regulator [Nocardioides sp.]|nr:TetR family transcriptional regulator [Nocardioides sp.]
MTEQAPGGRRERHKADTRRALEDAALRRFATEGYDATSVESIAADVGVSARTFFRYFAGKDAVLDMGRAAREVRVREAVDSSTGRGLEPVRAAVLALADGLARDRDRVRLRQRAAASSPALRGRVLDTITSWEHTVASALAERGEPAADVLAAVGVAVFRSATTAWLRDGGDLVAHVGRGFDALDERSG